ncbi:cytochrome b/b6 domain-containing protein [Granulosicoccaceae sp. 1_MG-2023]|nr:cytochrome b/b6 domain-containing protein [Granulosicoccaceae sp. 1_MG-2023]
MQKIKLWDAPVRLFHWSLVGAFAWLWYSGETGSAMDWHMRIGELVLALVIFRIIWGFVGSSNARFADFIRPGGVVAYLKSLFSRDAALHAGHNPLGGLVVLLMLLLLLVQAVTGLFTTDEIFTEGPLYGLVSSDLAGQLSGLHHQNFEILLVVVALHVAAIAFYLVYKRTNLVRPMITGSKPWPDAPAPQIRFANPWFGIGLFVVVYAAVRGVIALLGS